VPACLRLRQKTA